MTINRLKERLSKHGHIQIIKEGYVFSVLLTGKGLSNSHVVMHVQEMILEYAEEKYPMIEAMRNDDTFFCLILKPKS